MIRICKRPFKIVGNTSSSALAHATRGKKAKFVSGICRRNQELGTHLWKNMHLHLLRTHPEDSGSYMDKKTLNTVLPLIDTIRTKKPNQIYRDCQTLQDLLLAFNPLIKKMEEQIKHADIVLIGGTYYVPWCLLQAAKRQQKPVVLLYAGILSMEIKHLPEHIQKILKIMELDFYDPSIKYIFPSSLTKSTVESIFQREFSNSSIIHNGVPAEFLALNGIPQKSVPISFVGRNTSVKNPELLLGLSQALARINSSHRINMVTKSDPNNKLIQELMAAGVKILSPMNVRELAKFYQATNVLISPSFFETYGNVPIEAVSTGTPALISPSMGVTEVFTNFGIQDYITEFTDLYVIAQRLDEMIRKNSKVSPEVRSKIRKELSWEKVINRYLEICYIQSQTEKFSN